MEKDDVLENLKIVKKNAVEVVPSLLEVRLFGKYHIGGYDSEKSDVDIMILTGDEKFSALDILVRDSDKRGLLTNKILSEVGDEFRRREDLKLVTLYDMCRLIGRDEGRGDIGRNMYRGQLFYRRLPRNPVKLLEYLYQKMLVCGVKFRL